LVNVQTVLVQCFHKLTYRELNTSLNNTVNIITVGGMMFSLAQSIGGDIIVGTV
jgi:hypothetical protein